MRARNVVLILVGIAAFGLAVLPYLVVGKMPALGDWDSRHQILVPLGASLMLVGLVTLLHQRLRMPRAIATATLVLLAAASITI